MNVAHSASDSGSTIFFCDATERHPLIAAVLTESRRCAAAADLADRVFPRCIEDSRVSVGLVSIRQLAGEGRERSIDKGRHTGMARGQKDSADGCATAIGVVFVAIVVLITAIPKAVWVC
ncbi:MAG: hypothetical protein AB7G47_19280 [Mycolicibacterium sp.]|uniref:hypothetical protein n=1 Tax=Mycolicibacterium sp. TaxID=2320850 RepID=UPI003D11BBF8